MGFNKGVPYVTLSERETHRDDENALLFKAQKEKKH